MGRGDRPKVRWKRERQRKKKETERRKAAAKRTANPGGTRRS
ncbi:MAG: hypothetical protein ACRDJ4_01335 [Actinomycetota bacterium]